MSDPQVELHGIADLLADRQVELTAFLVEAFGERIPELPKDPTLVDLLNSSAGSNLTALTHLFRGHLPIGDIHAPPAAVEYARRLAQRGTTPSALLRAYRLGQQLVVAWANEQLVERVDDPMLALQTSNLLTDTSFTYIDAVSEDVMGAYQAERERWLANRSAVQRETVDSLLKGDRLELNAAESVLGYRLRQHHLGLVLWTTGGNGGSDGADLTAVERLVGQIGQRVGSGAHPLFVPRDRETGWAWIPIGRSAGIDAAAIASVVADDDTGVRVAVGRPGAGEAGFRTTHLGAAAAQDVALHGPDDGPATITYGDPTVRAAALLARDLPVTQHLVRVTLGGLAEESDSALRMRETLLAFVEERESYVATAARMHLHKNTVKYRVDKAIEARGKPLSEERLDLELALIACKWLGPAVVRQSGQP